MLWAPTASEAVVKVAEPPASVPVPMLTPKSLKVTVPLGVPAPGATAVTVAVKVTDWPNTDGFTDDATAVEELALLTVWVSVWLLPLKLPSPLYVAVMVWLPTVRLEVAQVALAPARATALQIVLAPSWKVTLPVGEPAPGAVTLTVAVKVTDCPNTDGFWFELSAVEVSALLTTWPPARVPVLVLKLPSPP